MKNKIIILLVLLPVLCRAQVKQPLCFQDYMQQVRTQNLTYAAEKLNLPIADAAIRSAKIFNDPSLSFEYANNDDHRMQMGQGYSVELSRTFSIGKRGARINLAKSEKELAAILLEDFFRKLRYEATLAYMEAIKQVQLYEVKENSYLSINDLAEADSLKFVFGKITEIDAMQSRVEANILHNELLQARNDLYHSYAALNIPLGKFNADTLYVPVGKLTMEECNLSQKELLTLALDNRTDLLAALQHVEVAQKALKLTRRERNMDFDLAVGYNYNTEVRNELAPAPKFSGITLGISIPLKFSNFNKGEIKAASYQKEQLENYYHQAELEVQTEVMQSYHAYTSQCAQIKKFNTGMLERAQAVIDGKIYSYNRGETSLLEVLNAQRTYNEVRALHIETQFNFAVSLLALEQSAGIWDVRIK